ncbi:MAG: hypothetical protein ACHQ6T_08660 [Myxococcota bacterium]
MARPTPLGAAAAALAAVFVAGCGPKLVRDRVFENPAVRVELRHLEQHGQPIPRGFDQPATIADVRIAHILASLSFEDKDEKRRPVIRSIHVYDLAGGIAKALAQAKPDDEVAAAAFPEDRRLGIFSDNKVTAFRLHLQGDSMLIEFMAVEEPLEKEGAKLAYRDYEIPSELPVSAPRFSVVTSESVTKFGPRGYSVAWRDDVFRRPVNLRERDPGGKHRTVLMELPPEKSNTPAGKQELPPGLSDAQIHALDLATAARSDGSITESEFQRRRRLILENKLDEAGYGATE